jgi:acyl-CoA thioester hydrolase
MENFKKTVAVRWSDLDPNFHVRHSAYYDYCAYIRTHYLQQQGITAQYMQQHSFGPILFREECVFKKEINFNDEVVIDAQLSKATKDFSRWTIVHQIFKNTEKLSAIITVDGAWMDVVKRKLTVPPLLVQQTFAALNKPAYFTWIE